MFKDLIYTVPKTNHKEENLKKLLQAHPEIKFVSLVGVDLAGNDTDEKIPIKVFLEDMDNFLHGIAAQTDGSSVWLPGIADLNNAKTDMVVDLNCNWFVDYNYDLIDGETNKPVGTLRIPCFLNHENKSVDSRYILKASIETFKSNLLELLKKHPQILKSYNITLDDIEDLKATAATELEFWVKTPNDLSETEELSTSQVLKEQYWARTKGAVRTALEECMLMLESYGFNPEMGHKEVGGVQGKLDETGRFNHIMEQLEIDWRFDEAVQAADNELFIRTIVKETFRRYGLEVSFMAKPIDGVAGNGEHTHMGMALKLKNGKLINLFTATKDHFLSVIGYGSIMGLLKNYEIVNPFVSATNDSLRRLKPGYEAPVCIVTSLGHSTAVPSRNRTVLAGLIRDENNPLATRFELRAPNPHTNTYLALSAGYLAMLDGVIYAIESGKDEDALLKELSKKPGEAADYLDTERAYRSEEDVFEDYTEEERNKFFGKAPATVYENLSSFKKYPEKLEVLKRSSSFTDRAIESYAITVQSRWVTEIEHKIMNSYMGEVRSYKAVHTLEKSLDLDISNWMAINELRHYLMKDTYTSKSLFTKIREATAAEDYEKVSELQIELDYKMDVLRKIYDAYKKNLLDI